MTARRSVDDATYFIRGITFKPRELVDRGDADAVVCMRTKNLQKDLDETDLIAVPKRIVRKQELYLQPGDTLISSANSRNLVGKCSYVGTLRYPATAGGFISIVRPKPGTHPRFLFHWLTSPRTQHLVRNLGRQTTNISNLDVSRFKKLSFPKIDYEEQRRIAEILDKADALHRKQDQFHSLSVDFLESAYHHIVGSLNPQYSNWNPKSIEQLASDRKGSIRSGPFGSTLRHSEFVDEGVAVLGIDNAVKNMFCWGKRRYITDEKFEQLRRYRVFPDDVIVTIMGTIGRSAVVPRDIPKAITSKHLATITCDKKKILPEVLAFSLQVDSMIRHQIRSQNKGAIMDGLSLRIVRQLVLRRPPMGEQKRFVGVLEKVKRIRSKIDSSSGNGSSLVVSLSQRAFRGEL